MKTFNLCCVLLLCSVAAGCDGTEEMSIGMESCNSNTDKIIGSLDRAIATLSTQSSQWQQTMKDLEQDLFDEGADLIANEVNNLMMRGIAAAGAEVRCETDYFAKRMKQSLINIKNRLKNIPETPPVPTVCDTVPTDLELGIDDHRTETLELYGYDYDVPGSEFMKVFLEDNGGHRVDVTSFVDKPSHYLLTVRTRGETAVPFTASSTRLVVEWQQHPIYSVAIIQPKRKMKTVLSTNTSPSAPHPNATAVLDEGYVLIGGGCKTQWHNRGQLLTASYPSGRAWKCKSKDHNSPESGSVTAYAIGVPAAYLLDLKRAEQKSSSSSSPVAAAKLPSGYVPVSGGCETKSYGPGTLLVDSVPMPDGWQCVAKDHLLAATGTVTAYVIGLRSEEVQVVRQSESLVNPEDRPFALARLKDDAVLVGGGCDVETSGPGSLLWATYPEPDQNGWQCNAKDHDAPGTATITAYAIGLKGVPKGIQMPTGMQLPTNGSAGSRAGRAEPASSRGAAAPAQPPRGLLRGLNGGQ